MSGGFLYNFLLFESGTLVFGIWSKKRTEESRILDLSWVKGLNWVIRKISVARICFPQCSFFDVQLTQILSVYTMKFPPQRGRVNPFFYNLKYDLCRKFYKGYYGQVHPFFYNIFEPEGPFYDGSMFV